MVWLIASLPWNRTPKIAWNNKKRPWLYQMEKMTRPAKHSSAPTSFPWQFKYWLNFRKMKTLENKSSWWANKRKDCMLPASTIYSSCSQRQGNGKSKMNKACCMDELGSPALSLGNGADEAREAVGSGLSSQLEIRPIQCAFGRGGVERCLQLSHPSRFQALWSYNEATYLLLLGIIEPCVSFLCFTMNFRPIMGCLSVKIHEWKTHQRLSATLLALGFGHRRLGLWRPCTPTGRAQGTRCASRDGRRRYGAAGHRLGGARHGAGAWLGSCISLAGDCLHGPVAHLTRSSRKGEGILLSGF